VDECHFCESVGRSDPPEGGWVYSTDRFRAYALPAVSVPGWVVLHTTRHAVGLAGLDEEESRELGIGIQHLSRAMTHLCDTPKIYMFAMADRVPHFHMMLGAAPRTSPGEEGGAALLTRILMKDPTLRDREKSLMVAQQLRDLLKPPM